MAVFESRHELNCSVEEIFDFLIQTRNVVDLSDPDLELVLESGPEVLSLGSRLTFSVHGYGIPQQLVHEITMFERPERFVEEQVQGPMRQWRHEHVLETGASGAVLVDVIEFKPPGGLVGLMLNERRIRESLERGFEYRRQELAARLSG